MSFAIGIINPKGRAARPSLAVLDVLVAAQGRNRQTQGQLEALLKRILPIGTNGIILKMLGNHIWVIRRAPGQKEKFKERIHSITSK